MRRTDALGGENAHVGKMEEVRHKQAVRRGLQMAAWPRKGANGHETKLTVAGSLAPKPGFRSNGESK